MSLFIKSQLNSIVSSLFDFLTTICCVEIFHLGFVEATIIGATAGAICNYILGRLWVFQSRETSKKVQAFWYFIVWTGSLGLNALGMYLLTDLAHVNYLFSKIFTAIMVGFFYNYQLHKKWVFRTA